MVLLLTRMSAYWRESTDEVFNLYIYIRITIIVTVIIIYRNIIISLIFFSLFVRFKASLNMNER